MNLKHLAQYLQLKMEQDLVADSEAEAAGLDVATLAQARADARAAASASGEDPDAAEAAVKVSDSRRRNIDEEVPTMEWCERIARKHSRGARSKVGKLNGLREEILDRVKKDPDKKDKTKGQVRAQGGRPV